MTKTNNYLVLSDHSVINNGDGEETEKSLSFIGQYDDLDEVEKIIRKNIDEVIQEDVFCWSDFHSQSEVDELKSLFEITVMVKNNVFTKNEPTLVGIVHFDNEEVCLTENVRYYVLTL